MTSPEQHLTPEQQLDNFQSFVDETSGALSTQLAVLDLMEKHSSLFGQVHLSRLRSDIGDTMAANIATLNEVYADVGSFYVQGEQPHESGAIVRFFDYDPATGKYNVGLTEPQYLDAHGMIPLRIRQLAGGSAMSLTVRQ